MRAAVIWLIQREDAHRLQLDARADPELSQAGREAADAGVLLCAYLCSITLRRIAITKAVPVDVPPASERRLKP
jgi:DNA-binding sugar fermentation-stimulating protein